MLVGHQSLTVDIGARPQNRLGFCLGILGSKRVHNFGQFVLRWVFEEAK
jgi:hypothetical protein